MSATYDWDISDAILQHNAWVYSPTKFLLKGDKVAFDLGLQMDIDVSSLKVLVRKNDPRSAKATLEIELKARNFWEYDDDDLENNFSFSLKRHFVPFQSKSIKTSVTSDWKEFCIFDAFTNLSRKNRCNVIKDKCCIKYTTISCRITNFSFNS